MSGLRPYIEEDEALRSAYEALGDPTSPPARKRWALASLGTPSEPKAAPAQHALGRLNDRPRAALPGPVGGVTIAPGVTVEVVFEPQVPMRGPWWLGMTNAKHMVVSGLQFGNLFAFAASGAVPGEFFDVEDPERLIAVAGRSLQPGMLASVRLRNVSVDTLLVSLCLWGNDEASLACNVVPERGRLGARDLLDLENVLHRPLPCSHCAVVPRGAVCPVCSEAKPLPLGVLVDSLPIAPAKREYLVRAGVDADATAAHVERVAVGYEQGDVWESPSDES